MKYWLENLFLPKSLELLVITIIWSLFSTVLDITAYVKSTLKIEDVQCYELNNNGDTRSFKVGVRESFIPQLLNPDVWPTGIAVKEFFRRNTFNQKSTDQTPRAESA